MVRALVGDSTMTSVRPLPLNARAGADPFTRFTAGARPATAAAALVAFGALAAFVALAFVAFFAGAFFLPGGVRPGHKSVP